MASVVLSLQAGRVIIRYLCFALGGLALAQEPIRVSTRLIETNVVVRDSHGPVRNLSADSFKILEDGKEQRIAVFRVSKFTAEAPKPLGLGIYSNRGSGTQGVRYRALLIDTLNTAIQDQTSVRSRLIRMFDTVKINDPLAIYVMGAQFRVLQDFTTDIVKLKSAIEAFRPEQSQALRMAKTPTPLVQSARTSPVWSNRGQCRLG